MHNEISQLTAWAERPLREGEDFSPEAALKAKLKFANPLIDKDLNLWSMSCSLMTLKNQVFDYNIITFGGKLGKHASLRTPSQTVKYRIGSIILCGDLSQEGLMHKTDRH
ncbi:hypothetical protein ILYODFUR_000063 [Ilyodon furcidens]|uniref:Uncharacterized protein n=1 Tax=Ilyodon furcidens TaxID=33524 RepID=A0ABV0TQL2_9TELE